jgi:hypothetical protein
MGRPGTLDQRPALQPRIPRLSHQLQQPLHDLQRRRRHTHRNITNGIPHVFDATTAASINNGIFFGNPIRLPYAG